MINELEKQFFDTFGIESQEIRTKECERCAYYEVAYDAPCYVCMASKCPYVVRKKPQITDSILLGLICILNKNELWGLPNDAKFLKQQVIQSCTMFVEHSRDCASVKEKEVQEFIRQVCKLFKENSNG